MVKSKNRINHISREKDKSKHKIVFLSQKEKCHLEGFSFSFGLVRKVINVNQTRLGISHIEHPLM